MRRRFRRRPPAWFWFSLLLAGTMAARWLSTAHSSAVPVVEGAAIVAFVKDGCTLGIRSPAESSQQQAAIVRLIGVRELPSGSLAARRWLDERLVGQEVRIALDKRRRDTDGAWLAYVHHHDTLVNARLLELRLAEYEPYPGDSAPIAKILREAVAAGRARDARQSESGND